jgi:hypothetical protein
VIPAFESDTQKLPPGIHEASWDEFVERFGYTRQRQRLLDGLRAALDALARAGCKRVWVDGSFVTAKQVPGDFDACWDPDGVDRDALDPVILDLSDGRSAQHAKYGGALWPADFVVESGNTILCDFQRDYSRHDRPKGIVMLTL